MEHTHLDQQRRQFGECPACDEAWEEQRERLAASGQFAVAERSIDSLMKREAKLTSERYGHRPGRDG